MRDRKLDRLFLRFRNKGDTNALGEVFDASAPELLRVAMSLVADPGEADDLLQATYLTAIERAPKWDASRRLVPWLLGILVHHAHDLRRKRGREVDPDRLDERVGESPVDEATRSELSETLRKTLAGLPARYREVLQPFVVGGEKPADIAARLGRAPGTVRMQIHRGLDLLRKGLPAGFALGVLASTAGRGLAAVRAEVLAHGSAQASVLIGTSATVAGGTAASTWTLGGITVSKKIALVAAAAVAIGSLAWVAQIAANAPAAHSNEALSRADLERTELSSNATRDGETDTRMSGDAGASARAEAEGLRSDTRIVSHSASLADLTGRVVEEDGSPVAHTAVVLYELGLEMLSLAPRDAPESAERRLILARGVTDEAGLYELNGARAASLHAIGVDPGGDRPYLRVIDEGLAPGAQTVLSDIVLPSVRPIVGQVVDAAGAPIAGARVRAGHLPSYVEWDVWAPIAADMPVWVYNKPIQLVVTAPPELEQIEALLPFPVTFTDAAGRFELPGAPTKEASVVVDHPGFVPGVKLASDAGEGARDIGRLTLSTGRHIHGRVVDSDGGSVVSAEVRAGASAYVGWGAGPQVAPLAARVESDGAGNFALAGVPEGHATIVLAVRRSPVHPWTTMTVEDDGLQTLKLPSESSVAVRVEDTDGKPVSGAELTIGRPGLLGTMISGGALLDPRASYGQIEELGQGGYAVHGLQRGSYVLRVATKTHALTETRMRVKRRMDEVVVQLEPASDRGVRVVDAHSGLPLERARVELLSSTGGTILVEARTDADGLARLERTPLALPDGAHLRIDHSAYGARKVEVEIEDGETLVELEPAGRVLARVSWDGGQAVAPMMIELDSPEGDAYPDFLAKHFAVTDHEGALSFAPVAPGVWRWRLFERYLDKDVIGLISGDIWPRQVRAGTVTVEPGKEAIIDIVLEPQSGSSLPEGTAQLAGAVTLDGEYVPNLTVKVTMREDGIKGEAETDLLPDGTYKLEGLPAGTATVTIMESERNAAMTWSMSVDRAEIELQAGRTTQADFVWVKTRVAVLVEDASGAPLEGVSVHASHPQLSGWTWWETNADGIAQVEMRGDGDMRLWVDDDGHGKGGRDVTLVKGDNERVTITLDPGAVFAGRATLPLDLVPAGNGHLSLSVIDAKGLTMKWVSLAMASGSDEFHMLGLAPGKYTAKLRGMPTELAPIEFDLPAGGRTDFTLNFLPK